MYVYIYIYAYIHLQSLTGSYIYNIYKINLRTAVAFLFEASSTQFRRNEDLEVSQCSNYY